MEAERYVVRELEGFNISSGNIGRNARPSLEVCVLDSRHNYRIVQAFSSGLVRRGVGGGRGLPSRKVAYEQVRNSAAELAARLNEAAP